jgi:uncharacterized membrane protein
MAVHDPVNGLRVGMLAGGLLGALVTVLTSVGFVWVVFVLGLIGGAIGFWTERRRWNEKERSPRAH